jgi:hypothetical protein
LTGCPVFLCRTDALSIVYPRIGKAGVDFPIEFIDDLRRCGFRRGNTVPSSRFESRYELSDRRDSKKVETRFAHMKRICRLDRLRPRGLSGAEDEVFLTATSLEKMTYNARSGMVIDRSRLHWRLKHNYQLMPGAEWFEMPWDQKVASPLNGDAVPP